MGEVKRTKQGYVMNRQLRAKVIQVMADKPGMTLQAYGDMLGVTRRTVTDYMTEEVKEEILERRAKGGGATLDDVDRAMMAQAQNGNVAAARLVYMRMGQKGELGALPSLEDLEAELGRLKELENSVNSLKRKRTGDGESVDDAGAVVADACG